MPHIAPRSEHDPLVTFEGLAGRAALEQLQIAYDVSEDTWIVELARRACEAGGVVTIQRNGDWVIFPS